MHRHGCLVLRPQQLLGPVRRASTATRLKEVPESSPSQISAGGVADSSAVDKAAALRARLAKAGSKAIPAADKVSKFNTPATPRADGERRRNEGAPFQRPMADNRQKRDPALSFQRPTTNQPVRPPQRDFPPHLASRPPQEAHATRSNVTNSSEQQFQKRDVAPRDDEFRPNVSFSEHAGRPRESKDLKGRPTRARHDDKFKTRGSHLSPHQTTFSNQFKNQPQHHPADSKPKVVKPKKLQFKQVKRQVYIPSTVTVSNLARILKVRPNMLKRKIQQAGITDEASYDYVLTADYAALLAEEFGQTPVIDDEAAFDLYPPTPHPDPSSLPLRPPVVTIMGHVDHGKTTMLDTLRSTAVAKGEAGGITQHIGAFSVPVQSDSADGPKSITFLDTPGHAAFSAMRARGAGATDIIVLVVAADDGLMPQTKEVIELYKKSQDTVQLVVAINKVDKPSADVESVQKALMAEGIQLESYGGDIPSVEVSGLTGKGLPDLVETLSVVSEMADLRAEVDAFAFGMVLESKVQQGLGNVGTVLVTRGSLKNGSHILCGQHYAKVRRMADSNGNVVEVATPGMAVTVCGWKTLPQAGDNIIEGSESDVKKALNNRVRQAEIESSLSSVDAINESRRIDRELRELEEKDAKQKNSHTRNQHYQEITTESSTKELRIMIKADVSGSAEAVDGALQGIGNDVAMSKVISSSVGDVTESDVMMAKAANAMIVAFSVGVPRSVQTAANQCEVAICTSNIIYKLMDDVRERVRALLPIIVEKKVTGEANVLQLFEIKLKQKMTKKVAGCRVFNGLVERSKYARVVRNGENIYEGSLDTLKQFKKDVTEVRKGTECGLSFEDFDDVQEGDVIQMFERIEKPGVF